MEFLVKRMNASLLENEDRIWRIRLTNSLVTVSFLVTLFTACSQLSTRNEKRKKEHEGSLVLWIVACYCISGSFLFLRQVLRPGALGRPRGIRWRERWEGGSEWRTHVNPWLIHFNVWQNPLQYCKVISLQLIKKKIKLKKFFKK